MVSAQILGPTPYDDVNALLLNLLTRLQVVLGEMLREFWQDQLTGPEWLRQRDYQAFAVLTMCRALYTLSEGSVVSKPEAAAWVCQTLDPKWRPVIERALAWRHQHEKDDLTEALDFLRFAAMQGNEATLLQQLYQRDVLVQLLPSRT